MAVGSGAAAMPQGGLRVAGLDCCMIIVLLVSAVSEGYTDIKITVQTTEN